MSYTFHDVGVEIASYAKTAFSSMELKAAIAVFFLPFKIIFDGDYVCLYIWLALSVLDMVVGVFHALKFHCFSRQRLYGWVIKMLTHTGMVLIFGSLLLMLRNIFGGAFVPVAGALSLVLFVLAATEALSILTTLQKLDLPVPPFFVNLLLRFKDNSEARLENEVDQLKEPGKPGKRGKDRKNED
jgi:phage-related holin